MRGTRAALSAVRSSGRANLLKTSLKAARSESAIDIGSVSVESVSPSAAAEAVREAASVSRSAETYL